jgi:hypothetical protein
MKRLIFIFGLVTALVLVLGNPILAQTADSYTPAVETVCDSQVGASYGLCNAYCEAMDCDSDAPQASATACIKVANKFINITGNELPCEQADTSFGVPLAFDFGPGGFVNKVLIDAENSWLTDPTWFVDIEITGLNGNVAHHGQQRMAVVDGTVFFTDTENEFSEVVFDWTADTVPLHVNELYTVCSQVIHIVNGQDTLVGANKCVDFGPF